MKYGKAIEVIASQEKWYPYRDEVKLYRSIARIVARVAGFGVGLKTPEKLESE
jgi:hypothetical protein